MNNSLGLIKTRYQKIFLFIFNSTLLRTLLTMKCSNMSCTCYCTIIPVYNKPLHNKEHEIQQNTFFMIINYFIIKNFNIKFKNTCSQNYGIFSIWESRAKTLKDITTYFERALTCEHWSSLCSVLL